MNPTFNMVMGTSGTGKSTRVRAIIEFLKQSLTPSRIVPEIAEGKAIGLRFKFHSSPELVIYGSYTKSGAWQGADSILGDFGDEGRLGRVLFFVLKSVKDDGSDVIVEGASVFNTSAISAQALIAYGVPRGRWYVFTYDDPEQYLSRIRKRSGTEGDVDNSFKKHNHRYKTWPDRISQESKGGDYVGFNFGFDAPMWILAKEIIPNHMDEFMGWLPTWNIMQSIDAKSSVIDDGRLL